VLPDPEQDQVVAALLARLWRGRTTADPVPPARPDVRGWAMSSSKSTAAAAAAGRIDPGLAKAGIALLRELPLTAAGQALLATGLHGDDILAAQREPWLVIDPKPHAGDPACDLLPPMLNGEDQLAARPAGLAGPMAALAGVDARRVRQWLFARRVQEPAGSPLMCPVGGAARARLTRRRSGDVNLARDDTPGTRIWTVMSRAGPSEFAM
jgi:streptomycin 6-kinase